MRGKEECCDQIPQVQGQPENQIGASDVENQGVATVEVVAGGGGVPRHVVVHDLLGGNGWPGFQASSPGTQLYELYAIGEVQEALQGDLEGPVCQGVAWD